MYLVPLGILLSVESLSTVFLKEKDKAAILPLVYLPKLLSATERFIEIDFNDTSASLETAMAVSKDFRLSKDKASEIIKEVAAAVKKWRQVASDIGLSKRDCDRMASAFPI